VTLGDEEAKRRGVQKSVLERAAPPTFDVAVEMIARNKWKVGETGRRGRCKVNCFLICDDCLIFLPQEASMACGPLIDL
jgi:hypothetical protein